MSLAIRLLLTVLIMGGLLILVLAPPAGAIKDNQPGKLQNPPSLAPQLSATPHAPQLSTRSAAVADFIHVSSPPLHPLLRTANTPWLVVPTRQCYLRFRRFSVPLLQAPSRRDATADLRSLH